MRLRLDGVPRIARTPHVCPCPGTLISRWARSIASPTKQRAQGCLHLRDIYNRGWHGLSTREEAQEAVGLLEDLHWLHGQAEKTGGRPTIRYAINPRISEDA
jgi:hypothetical protein